MAQNDSQAKALAQTYDYMRTLSKFYISKLSEIDIHKHYEIDGTKTNSAHWILAHLVWTEHCLIIETIGGKARELPWLSEFEVRSDAAKIKTKLTYEELVKLIDAAHSEAMAVLNALTDDDLDTEVDLMGNKSTKRRVLMHATRHEPMHIGQISWMLKANNVKMV